MAAKPSPPNPPHGQPGHVHGDEGHGDGDDGLGLALDPRQLSAQFDLVQRELQRTDRRLQALEDAVVEAQQAVAALRSMAESGKTQQVLLPIGSGVHVHGTVDGGQRALMPLGAGYFTEDTAANVAQALEQRVQSLGQQFQEASDDAERLARVASAINEKLLQVQQP